jgi:Flp pilus assembly protein TadD
MSDAPFKGITWTFGQKAERPDPMLDAYQRLQRAEGLRLEGQIDQARDICESLVRSYPHYFGALYTLGLIYTDKQQYAQALGFLVRAAMLNPENWKALTALSAVYLELGASEMAARTLEYAKQTQPNDPSIFFTLGEIYRTEREYELARDSLISAFELDRTLHAAAVSVLPCYMTLGQYAQAAALIAELLKSGVRSPSILYDLIELPEPFITPALRSELEGLIGYGSSGSPDTTDSAAFIRASALHRAGRYDQAWAELVPANQALFRSKQAEAAELADAQKMNLAQLKQKAVRVKDAENGVPISLYILGPSRSGKTTMESLVAALDGVKCGYENPILDNAIRGAFQSAGLLSSRLFELLPQRLDPLCWELYARDLSRRTGQAKVFTNTHPAHIHDVARIAEAFPNTRFVFVKRNLQDNAFRIYLRKYVAANAYAYDLKSTRDHILWYHEMIDVLAEKLPGIVRVVQYEDMVADPLKSLRTVADLCGLPAPTRPLPATGDDRGCAQPYRALMDAALSD